MPGKVTISDIARHAGVSVSTVSIVLNERPLARYVAEQTRAKVQEAAKKFHYRPNRLALAMQKQASGQIGFVCGDIDSPHYAELTGELLREAEKSNLRLLAFVTSWSRKREIGYLDLLRDRSVDGLILNSNCMMNASDEEREHMLREHLPLVLICNDTVPGANSIFFDYLPAMRDAVEHLIATGHRRIAMAHDPAYPEKFDAFAQACRERGISTAEYHFSFPRNVDDHASILACADRILHEKPDALIGASDSATMQLAKELTAGGMRIPAELSLISIDGTRWVDNMLLPLAVLRMDRALLAETAMRMLLRQISGDFQAESYRLELFYVPNASVINR